MENLYRALVAFQAEVPVIGHSRSVDAGKMKYSYAELQTIISAIRPALSKHKLAFVQMLSGDNLITRLCHESGEHIESTVSLPIVGLQPQAVGSILTYYRRYALTALLGLATDDDDDAAGGGKKLNDTGGHKSAAGKMAETEYQEWIAAIKAAQNKSELRIVVRDALAKAQEYGDVESHAALKASAQSVSVGLPE